jgi:hypothetical protein
MNDEDRAISKERQCTKSNSVQWQSTPADAMIGLQTGCDEGGWPIVPAPAMRPDCMDYPGILLSPIRISLI